MRKKIKQKFGLLACCATQICIACTCYGDVAGWMGGWVTVRHTPVLYQNGKTHLKTFSTVW